MIPKIIHQTWRDHDLPVPADLPQSWQDLNPDWEYRFWTDADLDAFVKAEYPALYMLYMIVERPVQRADIARYLILHKYGGVYADIDTRALAPLDIIKDETRVILSQEPTEHWRDEHAAYRNMELMAFNGTIASPAGHPFWLHVQDVLLKCRHAKKDVLESTGPLMLSGCVLTYPAPEQIALHSCHLFNLECKDGQTSHDEETGAYAPTRLSTHLWEGTWWTPPKISLRDTIRNIYYRLKYTLMRGQHLTKEAAAQRIDLDVLHSPIPDTPTPNIAVLIPVRNAAPYLPRCFALLEALEYPKEHLKISFCEGDSTDDTSAMIKAWITAHKHEYRGLGLVHFDTTVNIPRAKRWQTRFQKKRRGALAQVRNHLIKHGLNDTDNWALWVDVDVCDYPPDILQTLLQVNAKIVTPECVRKTGGTSYDMNAFLDVGGPRDWTYYKYIHRGLFQPPANYYWRRHLHDLRYLNQVPLSSVGGTMLLVQACVHGAGVHFPDIPYDNLLETEGFGKLAVDFGVTPIGLPNVEIKHVLD